MILWTLDDYDVSVQIPHCYKYIIWWVPLIVGKTLHLWGSRYMGSTCPSIFCEPKTALKNSLNLKKIRKQINNENQQNTANQISALPCKMKAVQKRNLLFVT